MIYHTFAAFRVPPCNIACTPERSRGTTSHDIEIYIPVYETGGGAERISSQENGHIVMFYYSQGTHH